MGVESAFRLFLLYLCIINNSYTMYKKTPRSLSAEFPTCQFSDCPMADTCLHQVAYPQLVETQDYIKLITPRLCSKDNGCKFYRSAQPVQYARGFTNFQSKMLPKQYREFMSILIKQFGRGGYFYRRRGLTALPPAEQEMVLEALRKSGIQENLPFDKYEEQINWFD